MEQASCSTGGSSKSRPRLQTASSPVAGSATADNPAHCVRLTEEQYHSLCELRADPLFKKAVLVPSSCPTWEKLTTDNQSRPVQCFTWIVYHYWLGSLRFALESKNVEGGKELYKEIFSVFEDLLAEFDGDANVTSPPRKRRLIFSHIGDGVFQLKLALYDTSVEKPQGGGRTIDEECRRRVRVLAGEAVSVARGSPWPKSSHSLYDHVAGLPLSLLETDGVEFSHEDLDKASIGPESAAYRQELRRSVAYVAEQMEVRGESVDWDTLYAGAVSAEQNAPHNLLSVISDKVERFIKSRGSELLRNT